MVDVALGAAQWVVAKALAPVADGVLGTWAACRNFGPNVEDLRMELLLVQATLEQAARKELSGPAMKMLLQKLRDLAHIAEDLLDKLDYFRIHDELHDTNDTADEHGKGCVYNLAFDARHTAKAVGKQLASFSTYCFGANAGHPRQEDARQLINCCAWQHGRQNSRGDSTSASNVNQKVSGCMPKLGKLLPFSSTPHPDVGDNGRSSAQETPKLEFNRADFSQSMKDIVEKLQLMRNEVNKILLHCVPKIVPDIGQSRPTTTSQSAEQNFYGRDHVMKNIIDDVTKHQYCDSGLTVLPVVGPGGIGKTTLIQRVYQHVQNHFQVKIWICVSLNFNLDKVLEQIKACTPEVKNEKKGSTTEALIEQRLKSKRFLLILDDMWEISNGDDWKKLVFTLGQSEEKGSMILVTTRFKKIADQVKKNAEPKELNSLEPKEFKKLFHAFVFDDGKCPRDKQHLLDIGNKIMEKLKGSPLAAKTVGRLLQTNLSRDHWKKVLNSREWEEADNNGIMPALKLSYDFLPFRLQQCFFYSALFPEDYRFKSHELINLWIGLDILIPGGQNQTFDDIGMSYLNELVVHGFFKEEESYGGLCYVMHDLLHDLALKVASHDCLSLCLPNVGSINVQPSTRHLSLSIEGFGEYDAESGKQLESDLKELKKSLKVENLQSLMLFGKMDERFAKIFGDFFGEANSLRVIYLPDMMYPVESLLHNFSRLVHLRCLCLGTWKSHIHLSLNISKFYHLRILDLERWHGNHDLPADMCNLAKLCHFLIHDLDRELHSNIYNVGKLKLLEELKVFRVNKKREGFEPKQLGHLTKLRELGIYNLEKIRTEEEAAQAILIEKSYLRKLTLDWDSERSSVEPGFEAAVLESLQPHGERSSVEPGFEAAVLESLQPHGERSSVEPGFEAAVLESLQPHGDLQVLCIRRHGGPSCPTWLGDEFAVEGLQSLYLDGVSWEVFPSLGKAWDLRELKLKHIAKMKEFIIEESFCRLIKLKLIGLGCFEKWVYPAEQESSISGDLLPPDAHMFPLLQVLVIRKCPKLLGLPFSNHIVSPDWFPKLQKLEVRDCPEFLPVIPISWIESLRSVTMECVKMLKEFAYSKSSGGAELKITGESDLLSLDQVLVFDKETSLEKLTLERCPPLELKHLLMLTSLKTLLVFNSDALVGGGKGDVEWQLPVEHIKIYDINGNIGKDLTELLSHLPRLSKLEIECCKNIKQLAVGVDLQQTTSAAILEIEEDGEEDDGVLLFPAHFCDSLWELVIVRCPELVLVDPPTLVPGRGGLQALRTLQRLIIRFSLKFLSKLEILPSSHIFPSSLQFLELMDVEGMRTQCNRSSYFPLSNLSSLVTLKLLACGEDLTCRGLRSFLTTGAQLKELRLSFSPKFFSGWEDAEGGEEQQTQFVSSTLHELMTDDAAGFLAGPICSFLSSSLTKLKLCGHESERIECFSKEQEDALQLLSSLQELVFWEFHNLQQLPAGLRNLTSLKKLEIEGCPAISSLPNDGLPKSLQELYVCFCGNRKLKQQCRGLEGTIPKIKID